MKHIKMFTGLTAAAVACSLAAVPASAAVLTRIGNAENARKTYSVSLEGVDLSKLDKITAELKADSGYAKGCIRYQDTENEWTSKTKELKDKSGEWTFENLEGEVGGEIEIQLWWVNPIFDSDGGREKEGTATIECVRLYDAAGHELKVIDEADEPPVTEPPVTEPPATEPPAQTVPMVTQVPETQPVTTSVTLPVTTLSPANEPIRQINYGGVVNGNAANNVAQGINAANQIIGAAGQIADDLETTSDTGTDITLGTDETTETLAAVDYSFDEDNPQTGNVTTGETGVAVAAAVLAIASVTAYVTRKKQ